MLHPAHCAQFRVGGYRLPKLTLTDQLADALAESVSNGVPLETAALAAGLPRQTVQQWLAVGDRHSWPGGPPVSERSRPRLAAFAAKIECARAIWEAKQVAGITKAAEQHNEKTGQQDWRARAWLLNNHPSTRMTYHEHRSSTTEQAGTVDHRHVIVRQLPDAELLALEQQALALPEPKP